MTEVHVAAKSVLENTKQMPRHMKLQLTKHATAKSEWKREIKPYSTKDSPKF